MAPSSKTLLGIAPDEIKSLCVITPFVPQGFSEAMHIDRWCRGKPFASGQSRHLTVIHSRIGSSFVGDAVLALENTPCRQLIFFGACGLIEGTLDADIGTIVLPSSSLAMESFTALVTNPDQEFPAVYPSEKFFKNFLSQIKDQTSQDGIKEAVCATLGSLILEPKLSLLLKTRGVSVVDMECSAFLSAAHAIKRPALALLYVTDIVGKHFPYGPFSASHQKKITEAQQKSCRLLMNAALSLGID